MKDKYLKIRKIKLDKDKSEEQKYQKLFEVFDLLLNNTPKVEKKLQR